MNYNENIDISVEQIAITSCLQKLEMSAVRNEIFNGLSAPQKHISSKYFYDTTGSLLFEKITQLPEYYPTRTEKEILQNLDTSFLHNFEHLNILELGSGDHTKISLLLKRIPPHFFNTLTYYPIDISESAIQTASEKLLNMYKNIRIQGYVADFIHQLDIIPHEKNRLFCFLGSTIGNFTIDQRLEFLSKINKIVEYDDFFLLGIDTIKERSILEAAYNDTQGLTEAFNLNVLNVINNVCQTNFNTQDFKHIAFFNEDKNRIEMHLEARKNIVARSKLFPDEITVRKGERIHTENSHKFNDDMISHMTTSTGFNVIKSFCDKQEKFKLLLLQKARS
ncbi:MAG: L-histidine N(alpha)-methyltransferase [Bacteroidales bacterium]